MSMKRILWVSSVGALVSLAVSSSIQAAEVKGSGSLIYVPVASETSKLPDGRIVQRSHIKGIVRADDTNVSFHLASEDCSGTTVIAADGNTAVGNGYCDAVDKDGDVWWLSWHSGPDGDTWAFIGGTGKYEGIKGGGTTKLEIRWPDGRLAMRWDGTWQMK